MHACGLAKNSGNGRAPCVVNHRGSMKCRPGCGACCIAPSISSPIPGMSEGKPAGVQCIQLTNDHLCLIFGMSERPEVCSGLRPDVEMGGGSRAEAMAYLSNLELSTRPTCHSAGKSGGLKKEGFE